MRLRTTRALVASSLAGLLAAAAMIAYQPTAAALTGGSQIQQECTDPGWDAGTAYVADDRVSHDGHTWRARWWTRDEEPGTTGEWGVWEDLGPCQGGPEPTPTGTSPPGECTDPAWDSGTVYTGGDRVSHDGRTWRAKWWTQGEQSGQADVWEDQGACDGGPSPTPTATPPPPPPPPDGARTIGYFTQWGIYDRDFLIRDVHDTGQAGNLTHIHYAFGNVNSDGECFMANQLGEGDAWADYQRRFTAAESVDGVADTYDQPLAGNFHQIRELKQMYPDLRVLISLGGWTWSTYFSDAALPQNREDFVASCIDLFIKGNLPILSCEPQGGPGSAFGVFDGIDLDWEWPASAGADGNVIRPEDRENFTALVAEFREQLDAYGAEVGRQYELSAFLPADPAKVDAGFEVPEIFDHLDYATLQGYDFAGAWDPMTNHQSQLHNPAANPAPPEQQFSVSDAVSTWTSKGAPAGMLSLGIPAYARGWTGVADVNNGLYQDGTAVPVGPDMYEPGIIDYKHVVNRPGTVFRDNANGAVWRFDGDTFWTYDDPQLVADKGDWVVDNGLGGLMLWSLDGDTGDLVSTMRSSLD